MSNAVITIRDIVDDYLAESNNYSDNEVLRYMRLAERCITTLNLFTLNTISIKTIEVNKTINTVNLPDDCLRVIRVGTILPNGRIYTLTVDNLLSLKDDLYSCEEKVINEENINVLSYDNSNILYNKNYNFRGGISEFGTYRINESLRRIELNESVILDDITIEYVSSGLKSDGVTYIPAIIREAVIAFIKWKELNRTNSTYNERAELEQQYKEELRKLDAIEMETFDEIYDVLCNTNSPLIKR